MKNELPIEIAHIELSELQRSLGTSWETLNYHKESGMVWVTDSTLSRVLYLDLRYAPLVEALNEVGDLEEHMSVFIGPIK